MSFLNDKYHHMIMNNISKNDLNVNINNSNINNILNSSLIKNTTNINLCILKNLNSFHNITDKCIFATNKCGNMDSNLNFYKIHYCNLESNTFLTCLLLCVILIFCFYILTDTANRYLSPSLTILSDKLKLSPSIAAMTFLSFGNGAPDVISSIVAVSLSKSPQGLELSLSSLLGAAVVVTSFVMSCVILLGEKKKGKAIIVEKDMYVREISCFLIVLIFRLIMK